MAVSREETMRLLPCSVEEGNLINAEEASRKATQASAAVPEEPQGPGRGRLVFSTVMCAFVFAVAVSAILDREVQPLDSRPAASAKALIEADTQYGHPQEFQREFGLPRGPARSRPWPAAARAAAAAAAAPAAARAPAWAEAAIGLAENPSECKLPSSEEKDWNKLSGTERKGAQALGWTEETWNCMGKACEPPPSEDKSWDDLSDTEKAGAKALGWTELSWALPSTEGKSWDGLSAKERDGAKALGYDKDNWECSVTGCAEPAAANKSWDELTKVERAGAEALGWYEDIWNRC